MLVVVEDRDVADLLQPALNLKATGCGNILKVDTAERLRDEPNGTHEFIDVVRVDAQRKRINVAELFKENALALHNGHAGRRPNVAKAQNG